MSKKIELMHELFGSRPGEKCSGCSNLRAASYNCRRYYKCTVYGDTASDATDWAKSWPACGLMNQPYTGRRIMELVRSERKPPEPPMEGQIDFFGGNQGG